MKDILSYMVKSRAVSGNHVNVKLTLKLFP